MAAIMNPARKLNYEVHGNAAPHLYVHFFRRYRGDQFEGVQSILERPDGQCTPLGNSKRVESVLSRSLPHRAA